MDKKKTFIAQFFGVRGSHPVSGPQFTRFGGNTPCIFVQAGNHNIILDAGTGIINLGRQLIHQNSHHSAINASIFFSHLHHDHTQGLPFFGLIHSPKSRLDFFLPDIGTNSPEKTLASVMKSPAFPVDFYQSASSKRFYNLEGGQEIYLGPGPEDVTMSTGSDKPGDHTVVVRCLHSYAHPQGVLIFRIEYAGRTLVYATDTEGYVNGDRRLSNFACGADLLIHDAQYTDQHYLGEMSSTPISQGYGHSTVSMACQIGYAAQAKQLALFHHDPAYDDRLLTSIESGATTLFKNTIVAYEGLQIDLMEDHGFEQPAGTEEFSLDPVNEKC